MSLKFNPLTSNFDYSGNGEPVATYSTFSAFPSTAIDGSLAVALDTDTLYVFNLSGTTWFPIGKPGDALSVGTIDTGSPSADGLKINASQAIIAQSASATFPGLVNNTTQSFSGNKTFTGTVSFPSSSNVNTSGEFSATGFYSSSSNRSTTGVYRMSSGDAGVGFRNNANSGDITLAKNTSDSLTWNGNPFVTSSGNITGASFISTNTTSLPGSGLLRLGSSEMIVWRNSGNSGDLAFAKDGSDQLSWNGHAFITSSGALTATNFSGSSSGTNTGDQTITLTSDVTGSGTGSFATTIAKIAGTTVSGTTGTGNVVFSASPTLTGTALFTNITASTGTIKAATFTTSSSNAATTGVMNFSSGDIALAWRNNANSANLVLAKNTSDALTWNGNAFISSAGALSGTNFSGTSSGTNTGDQTITLTGGVTGSGTGSFAATVVTNANLTGPITSVGNATSVASQTGTGSTFVMNTSPTIATATFTGTTSFAGAATANTSGEFSATGFYSSSSNRSTTGVYRMSSGDAGVGWRNNANSADLTLAKNTSDALTWNGNAFISSAGALSGTNFSGSSSGTNTGDQTITLTGDVTGSGTGSFATTVAKIAGTAVSGTTGTTNVVFSNSPTLVTPNLGTPSTLVGTNITGTASGFTAGTVTTNANLTGDITSSGNATTAAATQANITTLSRAAGVAVHGTNTNDNAAAGFVGQYVSAVSANTVVPVATDVWFDGTSISLTAGDWDVTAVATITASGATNAWWDLGISTTTGNSSSGLTFGDNQMESIGSTTVYSASLSIPNYRMSLSATTTTYLKLQVDYAVGTPHYYCRLSARRVR